MKKKSVPNRGDADEQREPCDGAGGEVDARLLPRRHCEGPRNLQADYTVCKQADRKEGPRRADINCGDWA